MGEYITLVGYYEKKNGQIYEIGDGDYVIRTHGSFGAESEFLNGSGERG